MATSTAASAEPAQIAPGAKAALRASSIELFSSAREAVIEDQSCVSLRRKLVDLLDAVFHGTFGPTSVGFAPPAGEQWDKVKSLDETKSLSFKVQRSDL